MVKMVPTESYYFSHARYNDKIIFDTQYNINNFTYVQLLIYINVESNDYQDFIDGCQEASVVAQASRPKNVGPQAVPIYML